MSFDEVTVRWLDAHADAAGWTALTDLDLEPRVIVTSGFLLPVIKPGHVSIAQSVDGDLVDSVIHILTASIIEQGA